MLVNKCYSILDVLQKRSRETLILWTFGEKVLWQLIRAVPLGPGVLFISGGPPSKMFISGQAYHIVIHKLRRIPDHFCPTPVKISILSISWSSVFTSTLCHVPYIQYIYTIPDQFHTYMAKTTYQTISTHGPDPYQTNCHVPYLHGPDSHQTRLTATLHTGPDPYQPIAIFRTWCNTVLTYMAQI